MIVSSAEFINSQFIDYLNQGNGLIISILYKYNSCRNHKSIE